MDVNLLYFTLYGNDPSGLTSWGAILIEDGDMESFVGAEQTELQAIMDGLTKCLKRFPTTLPIVIRSRHRTIQQLGKRWIQNWNEHGWETEEFSELITQFIQTIETRRLEWFSPPYSDPLDKNVQEYAIDEWEYHHNIPLESEVEETLKIQDVMIDTKDDESSNSNDIGLPFPSSSLSTENDTKDSRIEVEKAMVVTPSTINSSEEKDVSSTEAPIPISTNATVSTPPSSPHLTNNASPDFDTTISIDPLDKIQYPYIDDDGWLQLYTLFDTPSNPSAISNIQNTSVPVRILAYVDACHNLDLAAWSFALIDSPSRTALFKSAGQRQSTLQRSLLQGCIALLSSLRNSNHTIEIRTSRLNLIHLLELLMKDPYADCPDEWETESAFVSQLSFFLEQRSILIKKLPHQTSDFASQVIQHLSVQRLDAINNGDDSEFSLRKKFFPLEKLTN